MMRQPSTLCCCVLVVLVIGNVALFAHKVSELVCYTFGHNSGTCRRIVNPYLEGRLEARDPAPRCCRSEDCLADTAQRHAVITTLRNDHYLPLVQEVACSLNRSNPGLPLLVMTAAGDLSSDIRAAVQEVAQLVEVEDLRFPNSKQDRFALNWIKLHAWGLDADWDALLMVDADTSIIGDVSHLFSLPTDFAVVLDQDKRTHRYSSHGTNQGGVVFLRPCQAVGKHMAALAAGNAALQFSRGHAEQDFFDWYFKYSRMTLPLRYNAIAHLLVNGTTLPDGSDPIIVHYTWHKPFRRDDSKPGHSLLCRP